MHGTCNTIIPFVSYLLLLPCTYYPPKENKLLPKGMTNTMKTKCPCAIAWYSNMQTSLPIYDMKASNEFDSPTKHEYVQF